MSAPVRLLNEQLTQSDQVTDAVRLVVGWRIPHTLKADFFPLMFIFYRAQQAL